MGFSSLLNQIKHRQLSPDSQTPDQNEKTVSNALKKQNSANKQTSNISSNNENYSVRKIDPAVQRLKELRRQEKEKKEASLKANKREKSLTSKPRARVRTSATSKPNRKVLERAQPEDASRSVSPAKRLTFKELMEEAKDKTKQLNTLSNEPVIKKSDTFISKTQPYKRKSTPSVTNKPRATNINTNSNTNVVRRIVPTNSLRVKKPIVSQAGPKPLAQPSAQLKAKLEAKRKSNINKPTNSSQRSRSRYEYEEEDDYEEDDFIVDDDELEEEEVIPDAGYDRDEIWKMFNRGKSRSDYRDYDDDLSDMEATGTDILREEDRSEKRARREEMEEKERERRRLEEKRKRLGR